MGNLHEKYSIDVPLERSSDRSFGLTMSLVLLLATNIGRVRYDMGLFAVIVCSSIALSLLFIAYYAPNKLANFNRIWTKFGLLLHVIMTPLIMFAIYILVFMPIGLLLKLLGKNTMLPYKDEKASTYWLAKQAPTIEHPLKYQF